MVESTETALNIKPITLTPRGTGRWLTAQSRIQTPNLLILRPVYHLARPRPSAVQFKMVSMHSEKPEHLDALCAPLRLSEISLVLPFKQKALSHPFNSNFKVYFLTMCNHSSQSHLSFLANPNNEMKVNLHFTLPVQNGDKKTKHKVKRAIIKIKKPARMHHNYRARLQCHNRKKERKTKQKWRQQQQNHMSKDEWSQMRYTSVSFLRFTKQANKQEQHFHSLVILFPTDMPC